MEILKWIAEEKPGQQEDLGGRQGTVFGLKSLDREKASCLEEAIHQIDRFELV